MGSALHTVAPTIPPGIQDPAEWSLPPPRAGVTLDRRTRLPECFTFGGSAPRPAIAMNLMDVASEVVKGVNPTNYARLTDSFVEVLSVSFYVANALDYLFAIRLQWRLNAWTPNDPVFYSWSDASSSVGRIPAQMSWQIKHPIYAFALYCGPATNSGVEGTVSFL